jgi:predicted PurR-regulated permease PerM
LAWGSLVLVVASLYWAKAILIPAVLAILLTFILSPIVAMFQRVGLRRVPSVILAVLLMSFIIGGIGWALLSQMQELLSEIPRHRDTIVAKIAGLHESGGAGSLGELIKDIGDELGKALPLSPANSPAEPAAPVVVAGASQEAKWQWLSIIAGHLVETLAGCVLMIALLLFMLMYREDLRNRAIRLTGVHSLTGTTRAIDEAARRISRYLTMQVLVNACFALALSIILFLVGVPYALVWGTLIGLMRFMPYIGATLGGFLLTLFCVAVFPGWTKPLLAFSLFMALELFVGNLVEPWVFGQGTGVSPVAVLATAAFWTWLWGPIGLLLSTPIAVCLVVLGKYVPQLQFLEILLGDGRGLDTEVSYYQRLLARDQDEATELVESYLKTQDPDTVYDEVLLPALVLAKRDLERGELSAEDEERILNVTGQVLDDLAVNKKEAEPGAARRDILIVGCAARDACDELALRMFQQLIEPLGCRMEIISTKTLAAEMVSRVQDESPALAVIAALPPGGLAQTRYLCKRLHANSPELRILVGLWASNEDPVRLRRRLSAAAVTEVATTLLDSRGQLTALLHFLLHQDGLKADQREAAPKT